MPELGFEPISRGFKHIFATTVIVKYYYIYIVMKMGIGMLWNNLEAML